MYQSWYHVPFDVPLLLLEKFQVVLSVHLSRHDLLKSQLCIWAGMTCSTPLFGYAHCPLFFKPPDMKKKKMRRKDEWKDGIDWMVRWMRRRRQKMLKVQNGTTIGTWYDDWYWVQSALRQQNMWPGRAISSVPLSGTVYNVYNYFYVPIIVPRTIWRTTFVLREISSCLIWASEQAWPGKLARRERGTVWIW